jgi:hypothetical protein
VSLGDVFKLQDELTAHRRLPVVAAHSPGGADAQARCPVERAGIRILSPGERAEHKLSALGACARSLPALCGARSALRAGLGPSGTDVSRDRKSTSRSDATRLSRWEGTHASAPSKAIGSRASARSSGSSSPAFPIRRACSTCRGSLPILANQSAPCPY